MKSEIKFEVSKTYGAPSRSGLLVGMGKGKECGCGRTLAQCVKRGRESGRALGVAGTRRATI